MTSRREYVILLAKYTYPVWVNRGGFEMSGRAGKNGGGHSKHMVLMLVGCLAMLGGFLLIGKGSFGNLGWLLILLCPLLHVFMMRGHHGSHNHHGDND